MVVQSKNKIVFFIWDNIYASVRAGYSINFVFNQTDMVRIDCLYKLKKIKNAWATEND